MKKLRSQVMQLRSHRAGIRFRAQAPKQGGGVHSKLQPLLCFVCWMLFNSITSLDLSFSSIKWGPTLWLVWLWLNVVLHTPKGCWFDSWSGYMSRLQARSLVRVHAGSSQLMFLSLSLPFPSSLSKVNKNIFFKWRP
uniref:Uncharacterized protein n=1 Tax=Myotis myotis TaxID=51298 RepID=A0A7J7TJP3_MYOMY|nr:hypothetical protein mMyoMyo1_009066 [Myotis myotis]